VKKLPLLGITALGIAYLMFAMLVPLPAPTYQAWQLSILATEWGYWFALVGLIVAILAARLRKRLALPFVLGACIYLIPVVRADELGVGQLLRGSDSGRAQIQTVEIVPGMPLDVYSPAARNANNGRLVVVIHGGSWRGGDQTQLPRLNHTLAREGYRVAAITYRLSPAHVFPAAVEDVHAVVDSLANRWRPQSIYLLGRSAGGQLALLSGYTSRRNDIKGVISFYGPADLRWGWNHPTNPRVLDSRAVLRDYIGGPLQTHGARFDSASPVNFLAGARPTLLIHGGKDELVSEHHSRDLAARLRAAGKRVEYVHMPWATHGCDFAFNGPCGQTSTRAVLRFLETT
jgi:acetyl esterase/lipase